MPSEQPIDQLIDKCLDQTASEAERRELERRLSDPEARARFVAANRLHASLEAILKEETQLAQGRALVQSVEPGQQRTRNEMPAYRSWRQFAGVAAAILLIFGIWWGWGGGPAPTSQLASNRERPTQKVLPTAEISPAEAVAMFGLASAKAVK
jgi:anti-sigma factor RsiW